MEDRVTYDLGGPTGITLDGLTRLLAEKVRGKKHIWLIHIPIWFGFLVAYLGKISGVRLLTESNVLGASQHASVEHEAFDAKYGFTARPLAQGIADMLRHAAKTSKESYVLLSYLSGKKTSDYYARLYDKAVTRYLPSSLPVPNSILSNHSQLAALDAHTRVRSVNGSFQKKMLIAAALYETSPRSQELLREYSIFSMFRFFLSAGFTSVWFFAIGLFRLPPEARPFLHE
jgi:hypothetical protein